MKLERVYIACKKTTLEFLQERYGQDYPRQVGLFDLDIDEVESEHEEHYRTLDSLVDALREAGIEPRVLARRIYLTGSFDGSDLVVSFGGDGEMLDVSRYITGSEPVLGIRSTSRSRGYLLLSPALGFRDMAARLVGGDFRVESWTRIKGVLENGFHRIEDHALNEVYAGDRFSVGTSRYTLRIDDREERHRSSGVLVVTGTGSTGWYANIVKNDGGGFGYGRPFPRTSVQLRYLVRDPIRIDELELTHGAIEPGMDFSIKSTMNSDGVLSFDCSKISYENPRAYPFNRGSVVTLGISNRPLQVIRMEPASRE